MESYSGDNIPASKYSSVKYYTTLPSDTRPTEDGEHSSEQAGGTETRPRSGTSTQYIPKAGDHFNFQIPRKNKEKRALFQYVSSESREFEDILTILSSSYIEASSNGTFTYTKLRIVHSELLEKDFVEKRRELKLDGRTEKELEETHCFLTADTIKLPWICENGLLVGHSWITALGNPAKGVYLSKYSDLLQVNPFNPGVMGEIIIFKVIKGKVKSIYDNMSKNLLDPTPKFDSHLSKNASIVTSLTSYRAYELTQEYFYEYDFDELKARPRHVCPYAVVSFQFKGKDAPLQAKPMAPLRSNSQTSAGSKGRSKYTVWSGELVNEGRTVSQVSICSFSPPFLPFKLPEKLELGLVMRMDQVTQMIPSALFSLNLYAGSHQVLKSGTHCSLLEVVDKSKSGDCLAALLQVMETQRLVLVHMLADKGFLFLLSSVQMATPTERRDGLKKCLQALFVFQESRDVAKYSSRCPTTHDPLQTSSRDPAMPQLNSFVPALHHALVKVRCNPPADLSAGVERQARDYLSGLHHGKRRHIPMTEYDTKLDDRGKQFPAPKHHKLNMEGYLRSYIYNPNLYTMPVVQAKEMVESYCTVPDDNSPVMDWEGSGASGNKSVVGLEVNPYGATAAQSPGVQVNHSPSQFPTDPNPQKLKELINLILCWRNTEGDVRKKGVPQGAGGLDPRGLKRKTAERTLNYRKASQERGRRDRRTAAAAEKGQSPSCLSSVMLQSVVLRDVDLRRDRSEAAFKFSDGRGGGGWSREGTKQTKALLFDRMIKLGLPPNQDIDLRKQPPGGLQVKADYLETAGSTNSLEVFSPSSNGEMPRRSQSQYQGEEQMPWVLIPITGLKSNKYCLSEKDNPQDPRFVPQIPMANSSYPPCVPERRERSINSTLEELPQHSLSTSLEVSQEHSPYPSPCPSPCSCPSPMEDEQQLAETPCDPTEISGNHKTSTDKKTSTNQSFFQIPGAPASTRLLDKCRPSPKPKTNGEPTPTIPSPVEAGQEQVEGSTGKVISGVVAEDPTTMDVGQEEGEEVEEEAKELEEDDVIEVVDEEMKTVIKQTEEVSPPSLDLSSPELIPVPNPPPVQNTPPIQRPVLGRVNCVLDQQFSDFSTEMQILLLRESVHYSSPLIPSQSPPGQPPILPFSEYVSFYNSSPPMQAYVSSLRDRMGTVIDTQEQWIPSMVATDSPLVLSNNNHHHANHVQRTTYNWYPSSRGPVSHSVPSPHPPSLSAPGPASSNSHSSLPVSHSVPSSHSPAPPSGPGLNLASSNTYSSLAVYQFPSAVSQFNSNNNNNVIIRSSSFPGSGTACPFTPPLYNNPPQTELLLSQLQSSLAPLPIQPLALGNQWITTTENPDSDCREQLGTCKPSATSTTTENPDSDCREQLGTCKPSATSTTTKNTDLDARGLRGKCKPQTSATFQSKDNVIIVDPPVSEATMVAPHHLTQMIESSSGVGGPFPSSGPDPPAAISSLISQLKPELFSNLVKIIKAVQKNFV
ncbi:protein TASOR-like isoform X1 [Salvelinus alpinus]|uniref:protein TASOR-like isoform X1 n=1 Tax=Salvelinus alpinus TaxID=8036 RepID=UPI0039FC14B4